MEDNEHCIYFAMKWASIPVCMEDNTSVDIKNDENLNLCQINQKRIDSEWGPWSSAETANDSESEWKVMASRDVAIAVAHGGKQAKGNATKIYSWLVFVREKMNWYNAKSKCETLGGKLFDNLNGTSQQIRWLREKMGRRFWVGIYSEDYVTWKSTSGEAIPNSSLFWQSGSPVMDEERYYVTTRQVQNTLSNIPGTSRRMFICDLL